MGTEVFWLGLEGKVACTRGRRTVITGFQYHAHCVFEITCKCQTNNKYVDKMQPVQVSTALIMLLIPHGHCATV